MRTGAETGPCVRCGEPDGGRYQYDAEWRCWECLPASVRRAPRKRRPPPEPYTAFVDRVWSAIERLTGHAPFVLSPGQWASYCPSCRAGTMRLGLVNVPRPGFVVLSGADRDPDLSAEFWIEVERQERYMGGDPNRGTCSRGCTETEITEALA